MGVEGCHIIDRRSVAAQGYNPAMRGLLVGILLGALAGSWSTILWVAMLLALVRMLWCLARSDERNAFAASRMNGILGLRSEPITPTLFCVLDGATLFTFAMAAAAVTRWVASM